MDDQQRARELRKRAATILANAYSDAGVYGAVVDALSETPSPHCEVTITAIAAALRASPEWQPIESAPEGRLVVVGWLDTEDAHYPENYEFDYLEDGLWAKHEDCVEHAFAVAPPGSKVPKEQPPYQWWMDLPAFPAARPQGVKD